MEAAFILILIHQNNNYYLSFANFITTKLK